MRRVWLWTSQLVLAGLVTWFVSRVVLRNWEDFKGLELQLAVDLPVLAAAGVCVFLAYGLLIEAWRRMILGWDQRLQYRHAARIWCISNMGRYLPGKVWSVAGLAVMAERSGVSGWAATGSAIAMQALAVGTGAIVVALTAPGIVPGVQLVVVFLFATLVVTVLVAKEPVARLFSLASRDAKWQPLSLGSALSGAAATLTAWVVYGVVFWLLAKGLLPDHHLSLRVAAGVFAAGYVVGLLAIFAPGGIGVREAIFVALLAPSVGSGAAVALAIGSRLLLTLTEIAAALLALALGSSTKEEVLDRS